MGRTLSSEIDFHSLNERQSLVVKTTEGPVLVLAGAGTGKTRAVTYRIAYLLTQKGIPGEHILAVTFTNKAAEEMRGRVLGLVGKKRAQNLTLSTFHSLCVQILRDHASKVGLGARFTIYDEKDQLGLIRTAIQEEGVQDSLLDPRILLYRISNAKSDLLGPDGFKDIRRDKYARISQGVYETYQEMLQARNAVDFDDLIMKVILLFQENPDILSLYRERFRYIMVDEFQDTSRSQVLLVRQLAGKKGNVCVVGDDDQSIYAWRGAYASNILEFERDFGKTKVIRLEENYRSTQRILQVANALIHHNHGRMDKTLFSRGDHGNSVDLVVTQDEHSEAETVVACIKTFHDRFNMPYRNAAILYRSNQQSRVFEETLRTRRIPYRLVGGQSFYDRKEVRDVVAYLKLMENPRDEAALLRIIHVPKRGIGERTLARVVEAAHRQGQTAMEVLHSPGLEGMTGEKTGRAIRSFFGLMEEFRSIFRIQAPDQALGELLKRLDYQGEILKTSRSEAESDRRWENVEELVNSLSHFVTEDQNATLADYLDRITLMTQDEKVEKEGQDNVVTLITIHSAKGLEFPAVFLVGMEEGLLPHAKSLSEDPEALAEERRLCYVAITRAQRYLAMTRALTRRKYGKKKEQVPSRFLNEIPEELLEVKGGPA